MRVRVLLVDDEAELRDLWREVLTSAGYAVSEAASVAEARERIAESEVDVAVVDWTLPDGKGAHVVDALRAAGRTSRTIMVSGLGPLLPEGHGADVVLAKPFRLRELVRQIEDLAT